MPAKEGKHTPFTVQPLETARNGYADWQTFAVRDARNVCVAVVGGVDHLSAPENADNARLFAAAPDLLDALTALMRWVPEARMEGGYKQIQDAARAAILKAEGA